MKPEMSKSVVPAKAGTHPSPAPAMEKWVPAFAGTAVLILVVCLNLAFASAGTAERISDLQVLHVLDRLAFGPTQDDVRHVNEIGIERYIAEQLAPDNIPEPPELTEKLAALDTLKLDP